MTLHKRIIAMFALLCVSVFAHAQFTPGQILTAAQLNSVLASKTSNTAAAITGGTITGLSAPIPLGSGGTGAAIATGAVANLQYLTTATGGIARSLQSKFADIVSVTDFGADPSDTNDSTAAFQAAALASTYVLIPPGGYKLSSSISIVNPVTFFGSGVGATRIYPSGNFDVFAFSTNVNGGGIRDLTINGAGITGGNLISNVNQGRFKLHDIQLVNGYNGIYLQDFNVVSLDDVWLNGQTGQYFIKAYGSSVGSANVLDINNVETGSSSATSSSPVNLILDSGVATVDIRHFASVKGYSAIQITNSAGLSSGPQFVTAYDVQADFPYAQCISADGGSGVIRSIYFDKIYCNGSATTAGIQFASTVGDYEINGGKISGNYAQGVLTNGSYGHLSNLQVTANSQVGSGQYSGIEIGASAAHTQLDNSLSGMWSGYATNLQSYGLQVDAGAIYYNAHGNDFYGNVTGPYLDSAADANSLIAFNGGSSTANNVSGPIRATSGSTYIDTVSNSSVVALRSAGLYAFAAQAPASSVNYVKAFGTVTGVAPVLQAVGTDANISLNLKGTGTGSILASSPFSATAGVAVTGSLTVGGAAILPNLTGTTGSIGGSALTAGACTSGTVAVTGSTTAMAVQATPVTYPGDGIYWEGYVSAAGTVTVKVCASAAATPTASTYNVRVLQ